jgi:hypothetical protein
MCRAAEVLTGGAQGCVSHPVPQSHPKLGKKLAHSSTPAMGSLGGAVGQDGGAMGVCACARGRVVGSKAGGEGPGGTTAVIRSRPTASRVCLEPPQGPAKRRSQGTGRCGATQCLGV